MQIFQKDILGNSYETNPKKEKEKKQAPQKSFPNINVSSAISEIQATNDSMLIHRSLERKLSYKLSSENMKKAFLRIFKNELKIKAGLLDPVTATRDSLLAELK